MKNLLSVLVLTFGFYSAVIAQEEVSFIRSQFYKAAKEEISVDLFLETAQGYHQENNLIITGYKSMAYFLMAKNTWNPIDKFKYFNSGKKLLESALNQDYNNYELRFLRFCIQNELPFFLNYFHNLEEDKQVLINNWASIDDEDLKIRVSNYLGKNSITQ